MNKLTLQRVLPVDGDITVELLVDGHEILCEVSRAADGRFGVRFGLVPPDVKIDLGELLDSLQWAREQFDSDDDP